MKSAWELVPDTSKSIPPKTPTRVLAVFMILVLFVT